MKESIDTSTFSGWVQQIKGKIRTARNQVALSINTQLLELYWELGKEISIKQKQASWGSNFIENLSKELKSEFPEMTGFSRRNLYAIKQWYEFYSEEFPFVPQAVAQIPWGHNRLLLSKSSSIEEALFYAQEIVLNGWSRDTLEVQIDHQLYLTKGKSVNNFTHTLPIEESKIAIQTLKDPYNFDFLGLQQDALEREIEIEITKNIRDFLLELGKGFAFLGNQYKIEISENDYFINLLFYHLDLRSFIVIELKAGKFKPEHAGKLNFYLSAVDSQLKRAGDNPTIGILLCKKKDRIEAEYALRDINKPMGISEYRLTEAIPAELKTKLPSIQELENELTEKLKNKTKQKRK